MLSVCVLMVCAVFGFGATGASAKGLVVDTPLLGVDVGLDEDGVEVGVDVPPVGLDVDADVSPNEGSVEVEAGVNPPSSGSGSGESGSQTSGGSSSAGSGASSDSRSDAGGSAQRSEEASSATTSRDSERIAPLGSRETAAAGAAGTGTQAASTANGLVGLLAANRFAAATPSSEPAESGVSVVTQLVNHVPTWLWIALGVLLAAFLATAAYALLERKRRRVAHEVATHDPLTGVANVKAFEARLSDEWARAQRYGNPLGVLMIDLDRFKEVNDLHGHAAGDEVLIATANELSDLTRATDLVARVGGDEFAIICPETGLQGLEKMREHLERTLPPVIGFGVGVSIGAAELGRRDAQPAEMLARADLAMYDRKSARRRHADAEDSLTEAV